MRSRTTRAVVACAAMFAATACAPVRSEPPWASSLVPAATSSTALDAAVAVTSVVGCALLFLHVFTVPLPVSTVLGV